MNTKITVKVLSGTRVTPEDIYRAETAALEILEGHDIDWVYAEFMRQWPKVSHYSELNEDGLLWLFAEDAANNTLRKGWSGANGATCAIELRLDSVEILRTLLDAGAKLPDDAA